MADIRRSSRIGSLPSQPGGTSSRSSKRQKKQSQGQDRSFSRAPHYMNSDLEILKTGSFADAVVVVEGMEIKVHRSIVCPRSGFFQGALSGNFQEGKAGCVEIEGFTHCQIRKTIHFIYAGNVEDADQLDLAGCIDLIKLGDYFLVEGMVSYAARLLWARLSVSLKAAVTVTKYPAGTRVDISSSIVDPYQNAEEGVVVLTKSGFLPKFEAAVHAAFSRDDAPPNNMAQLILADFIWAARGVLIGVKTVEKLNKRYPEFGSKVFTVMGEGPQSGFLPSGLKCDVVGLSGLGPSCKSCGGCGRNWRTDKWPVLYDPTSLKLRAEKAYCSDCVTESGADWKPFPEGK